MGYSNRLASVVGGGIAGCAAALVLARLGFRVELATGREGEGERTSRLVSVPARVVPLLVELGVIPDAIPGLCVVRSARIAWETATPLRTDIAPKLHLDQARLEAAFRGVIDRNPAIEASAQPRGTATPDRLIDATGRRSTFATERFEPAERWITRFWQFATTQNAVTEAFALAALPIGYALRIADAGQTMIGIAAPRGHRLEFSELAQLLADHDAGWLIGGAARRSEAEAARIAKGGASSVAWTAAWSHGAEPVGDALLAGDTLASQGVAWALSDAMSLHLPLAERLTRAAERRRSHLDRLHELAVTNRFAAAPTWRNYAAFLAEDRSANGSGYRGEARLVGA